MRILFLAILSISIAFALGDDKDQYGATISFKEKTKISEILNNPDEYSDKIVFVEGEVLDVCPMAGCWIELKSDLPTGQIDVGEEKIKVKVKDREIVSPIESKGKIALVEGKVYKIELTVEEAVEYFQHQTEELFIVS